MKTNDQAPEDAPEAEPAAKPATKPQREEAAADRRGFLHRLASFGLGEEPDHLLVPRPRLLPAESSEAGD
ncbi:MAG TPA: hypothetical protein VFS94_12850 [Gemmatimonadales bacterium]|nr:hypothetical protein [Gemmatimonadales bacterium]